MGAAAAPTLSRAIKWVVLATALLLVVWHYESVQKIYATYTADHTPNPGKTQQTKPQQPTKSEPSSQASANKTTPEFFSLEEVQARQPPPPPNFDPRNDTFDLPSPNQFDPAGPRPDQFVLLTAADGRHNPGHHGDIKNMLERALQNRQEYCDAWGYICHWVNTSRFDIDPYGSHHKKAPAIVETFQTYPDAQWIWVLDEDAIIMSPDVDQAQRLLSHDGMREHLLRNETIKRTQHFTANETDPNDIDVIIGQEGGMMNSGSILFRRSESSRWIFDWWRSDAVRDKSKDSDQKALIRVMDESIVARRHLGVVQFRLLQSWAVQSATMGWQPGDLVIHFAGCWIRNHCQQSWEKYWKLKGTAPEHQEEESSSWEWPWWSEEEAQADETEKRALSFTA